MEIRKIYFDMDGVLADFDRGIEELCKMPRNDDYALTGKTPAGFWEAVKAVDHFYDKLEFMPGAKEFFDAIYEKHGDKCEILSAIPKPHHGIDTAKDDKISWTKRLLSKDVVNNIVYREEKKDFCQGIDCILIDDMVKNISEWNEMGGTGVLFTTAEETMKKLKELGIL